MSNQTIDDLLNASVDELVDMKEFKPLPIGTYVGNFSWEKTDGGVKMILSGLQIVELADPDLASEVEPDTKFQQQFLFHNKDKNTGETVANEFGQGQLKKYVNEVFKPTFGGDTLVENLDAATGAEVKFSVKHRADKNDKDVIYSQIGKIFQLNG